MAKVLTAKDVVERREDLSERDPEPLLVLEPLAEFLDAHGLGSGPIRAESIGDGHSFETFLLRRDELELVLRRPPRPPYNEGWHDVLREAQVLTALHDSEVRAPRVLAVCEDNSVLGVPFMVMDRIRGTTLGTDMPEALDTPAERRRVGEELVDALVELHACDYAAFGLADFGRPDDFLMRRLRAFTASWQRHSVRPIPEIERTAAWLERNLPQHSDASLVHGDYRLGNVMYSTTAPAQLLAIMDWETTTLGDPLTDLGFLVTTYPEAVADEDSGILISLHSVALRDGFPSRDELIERYAARSGRPVDGLRWYMAYSQWRVAIQLEGLYAQYVRGHSTDPFHRDCEHGVPELARRAARLIKA